MILHADAIFGLIASYPDSARPVAEFRLAASTWKTIRRQRSKWGDRLCEPGSIAGYPATIDDAMPDGRIAFGEFPFAVRYLG